MFGVNNLSQIVKLNNKEGLEALFEYATEGILVANNSGEVLKSNPAVERMFGYGHDELLGKPVELLIPDKYAHKHIGHRDNFYKKPHPRGMGIGFDLYGKRKDGSEFPIEISLSPYVDEGETFVIAFIIDITLRKTAEDNLKNYSIELEKQVADRTLILREAIDELEKTKDELYEVVRNERELSDLKSRFVSLVSHEFRTPLAAVLSSLSLVRQYGEKGNFENQAKHIQRIKESVNGLTDILNDLLSISKLEEGKVAVAYEKFELSNFINQLMGDLRSLTKKGQLLLYTHIGPDEVCLDKKIIKHILFNLVSNAIKFSPEGKNVFITSGIDKNHVMLTVKDEGMGISAEDQEHLFERFFRGHNTGNVQGTGLGLNIVAKYVELLNGTIDFTSELNKGTTFVIKLPNISKNEQENPVN